MTVIRGVEDISDDLLDRVLQRAEFHRHGGVARQGGRQPPVTGLAFFESSLRTRVGFAVATARLGGHTVDVIGPRQGPTSSPEPWTETLRILSGMVDIVVTRPGIPLDAMLTREWSVCPVVNGGDVGPNAEHPTQALIDVFAIETMVGPVGELTVGLTGDLGTRASRSFLRLLSRRPPRRLVLFDDAHLLPAEGLPADLTRLCDTRSLHDTDDVDVIATMGLPDGAVQEPLRRRFQVDRRAMDRMPSHGVVLSPMPVLDEIETASLGHPRVRVYDQSDLAVHVRVAVLAELLEA